jgi:riboflavin synthase
VFTGLIEEIGTIRTVRQQGSGVRLVVGAAQVLGDLKIDDSVAINGACQTVVSVSATSFEVEAVEETLTKTTLGTFRTGTRVNLERALQLGARLGGHLVQGHVDCRGSVASIEQRQGSWLLAVRFPAEFARYVIPVGSVCINGISLTAARVDGDTLTTSIIPHTWAYTTLNELRTGAAVNLEFDLIGKYVERMLQAGVRSDVRSDVRYGGEQSHENSHTEPHPQTQQPQQAMSAAWLQSLGY